MTSSNHSPTYAVAIVTLVSPGRAVAPNFRKPAAPHVDSYVRSRLTKPTEVAGGEG